MGLLCTEVEITLVGVNIPYYKNLGYKIPKVKKNNVFCVPRNTKIKVNINDVPHGSNVKVDVMCDLCDKKYQTIYQTYCKHNYNGKCYCRICANKLFNSGENNSRWRKDLTDEEREIGRNYPEYTQFVKRVYERDKYTCQCCHKKPKHGLAVHHLNGYNWFIEGRTDETNAVTLCENCHSNFHYIYGYGDNTREQYEEWIGYTLNNLEKYNGKLLIARKIFCYEENKIYESVSQFSKIHNYDESTVSNVCNRKIKKRKTKNGVKEMSCLTAKGNHLFWLDEYETMAKEEILNIVNTQNKRYKKVICITTKEIFDSIELATRKYNIYGCGVGDCCIGKQKTAGKSSDNTPLQWMYYDNYLQKLENGEHIKIEIAGSHKNVICLTTGKIFYKVVDGANYYNVDCSGISKCCNGKVKSIGKLPDGTKLQWMYYECFLKLPIEEQNKVLLRNKESSNDGSFVI